MDLSPEDKNDLRDLILQRGYKLYKLLLRERLEEQKVMTMQSKEWEAFIAERAKADYLERTIIPFVDDILEED